MTAQLGIEAAGFVSGLGYKLRRFWTEVYDQNMLNRFIDEHSIPRLVATWKENPAEVRRHLQLIPHRLLNDPARGIVENTLDAGKRTLEAGFNLAERDVSKTGDGNFVGSHPKDTAKILQGTVFTISSVPVERLNGRHFIVRQMSGGQLTGASFVTSETMAPYEQDFRAMVAINSGYTEFSDARDDEAAQFMAFIREKLPEHLEQLVVQIHAHEYRSFEMFQTELGKLMKLPLDWHEQFCICLVLTGETLIKLASVNGSEAEKTGAVLSVDELIAVGKKYLSNWLLKKWNFLSVEFAISEAGTWLSDDGKTAKHPYGHEFLDPQVISEIAAIKALDHLNTHYAKARPDIFRMATQRTPDFFHEGKFYFNSMLDGSPVEWPAEGTDKRYLLDAMQNCRYLLGKVNAVKTDDVIGMLEQIYKTGPPM